MILLLDQNFRRLGCCAKLCWFCGQTLTLTRWSRGCGAAVLSRIWEAGGGGNQSSGEAGLGIDIIIIILLVENYMAANIFDVSLSVSVHAHLWGGSFESTPGVEATHEAVGLVSLPHQSQLPGVFSVLRAHVLDVNLGRRRRRYNIKMFELKCAHRHKNQSFSLTWQALRLSLISTWLVWVPTHMYTWGENKEWKT